MPLKTVLESLEGVDDAIKTFYTENDGQFYLEVEGVDSHPDVVNLKTAYERVKADKAAVAQERDALKAKVSELPDDFDPQKWDKLKDGKPDEAALVSLRQELEAKLEEANARAEAAEGMARKTAIERDLTDALAEVGVTNALFTKAARQMIEPSVKVGEDGTPVVDTDMGPLALSEHVKRWAAGEGRDFVTPPAGGGAKGGGTGGGGDNPLLKKVPALADLPVN